MARKQQSKRSPSRKPVSSVDDPTTNAQDGAEMSEAELGRVSGGSQSSQTILFTSVRTATSQTYTFSWSTDKPPQ